MDVMTPAQRRRNMQHVRSKDTKPEIKLRKLLYHEGFRYQKNWKELPGKPDIVLTKQRICIFIDGEYFHGKDWESGQRERVKNGTHADYWLSKIERNMERDRQNDSDLNGLGWTVLRFWSRDVLHHPEECLKVIRETVFSKSLDSE